MRLLLIAVSDPAELQGVPGVPFPLPDWVEVRGVVSPAESLLYTRAADVLVGEGTSTMHEGSALRTPLVLVPGLLGETRLLARRLGEERAATTLSLAEATPEAFAAAFQSALERDPATLDRAHSLVTGGGGAAAAARTVLDVAARRRAA